MLPPFPSGDLAKLVLGYLAEEKLMVAYDEFLQASPYLDALQNEYGWMFMYSLRSILAEYRAVKIYVETGMPFTLRKKIFHCSNLLDIVKFLAKNVDIDKVQSEDATEKARYLKQNVSGKPKASCEICTSLNLVGCACKPRAKPSAPGPQLSFLQAPLHNSIETTHLDDLPGNHVTTRKKHVKVLDKDSVFSCEDQSSDGSREDPSQVTVEERKPNGQLKNDSPTISTNSTVQESDESRKKIEEFDDVFKSVVSRNSEASGSTVAPPPPPPRVASAGTFQDFAAGVASGERQNANVPDSSTSDNLSLTLTPMTKDYTETVKGPPKCNLLLQISRRESTKDSQSSQTGDSAIEANLNEHNPKIKILSDVTVGKQRKVYKGASSTPATCQNQSIVINGTPAYKPISTNSAQTYTKEDIMAMSLIIVPAPGASNNPTSIPCVIAKKGPAVSNPSATCQNLGPLVIDVPPTPVVTKRSKKGKHPKPPPKPTELSKLPPKLPDANVKNLAEADLIKSLDLKNVSVPKDTITGVSNTPHAVPPVRKSSSTPRRTSHVRVLDFATPLPRRILHETNEQLPDQPTDAPVELTLSASPNEASAPTTSANHIANDHTSDNGSTKENTTSKANWDADLRSIIGYTGPGPSKRKNTKRNTKKKKTGQDNVTEHSCTCDHTTSAKGKRIKKSRKVVELEEEEPPLLMNTTKPDVPVKPNINIISGGERVAPLVAPSVHADKTEAQHKPEDKDEDCIDTPENERLSLQNVIGAKLNISDLLETPYKQAIYDLQMGTPRFLAPDIPDEPLSDIKIMNIPTPRFLDTPKPAQATPSSYTSRPTDYSSGGSYYKPDDQDYIMPTPDLRCAVSSSKEDITVEEDVNEEEIKSGKRPRRQCTKNVSYYQLANPNTKPRVADNVDTASSCSDSTISTDGRHKEPAKPRERSGSTNKVTKNRTASKKKKTPVIKAKSFVRIKPRQSPAKATPNRNRKKAESPRRFSPGAHKRNRSTSKDKNVNTMTPPIVPASTKSRRKSSTPRKLHTTKSLNSENASEKITNANPNATTDTVSTQHSDNHQMVLRWSDDCSHEAKVATQSANDCEDIAKIRDYIQTTDLKKPAIDDKLKIQGPENEGSLRADLVKRGFDMDTAKKIERDLLDTPPPNSDLVTTNPPPLPAPVQTRNDQPALDKSHETDNNVSKDLQVAENDDEEEEVEFTVHDCDEESSNFILVHHDVTETRSGPQTVLKDNYCMEVFLDEGVAVMLRAAPFTVTLDQSPVRDEEIGYSYRETQMAVNSICNIDRLYTPLKETIKDQYKNVFDSTLTSLDTPLKSHSPPRESVKDTEIVSDEEQADRQASKKRKRSSDSRESECDSKKTKYYLASASIQNIDIESVLTKLHGP